MFIVNRLVLCVHSKQWTNLSTHHHLWHIDDHDLWLSLTPWSASISVKKCHKSAEIIRNGRTNAHIRTKASRSERKKVRRFGGKYSKTWKQWVLFQTNRGKQGRLVRHLPLLKGTTCLLLFHLPASPGTLSEDLNVTAYIVIIPLAPLSYLLYHIFSLKHNLVTCVGD